MKTVLKKNKVKLVSIGVQFVEDCISRGSFSVKGDNPYKAFKKMPKVAYAPRLPRRAARNEQAYIVPDGPRALDDADLVRAFEALAENPAVVRPAGQRLER